MELNQVETGNMSGKSAAEVLDISLRHVRRTLVAYMLDNNRKHNVWIAVNYWSARIPNIHQC